MIIYQWFKTGFVRNKSLLGKESVVVNVVLVLHVNVHIALIVQVLVHLLSVNLLNVKSSPLSVAVTSPLVSFTGVSDVLVVRKKVLWWLRMFKLLLRTQSDNFSPNYWHFNDRFETGFSLAWNEPSLKISMDLFGTYIAYCLCL